MSDYIFFNGPKDRSVKSGSIREGVKVIGRKAFMDCKELTEIVLPESLETINYGAFMNCVNLTSIVIPKSVKQIDNGAFMQSGAKGRGRGRTG